MLRVLLPIKCCFQIHSSFHLIRDFSKGERKSSGMHVKMFTKMIQPPKESIMIIVTAKTVVAIVVKFECKF